MYVDLTVCSCAGPQVSRHADDYSIMRENGPVATSGDGLKRILFVDDEAPVLASLRNLLRKDRYRWDLVFAHGGPEAARLIGEHPFDVIITDMRMPDLDGAALVELVQTRWPQTVTIILSGHAAPEDLMRALPLVREFVVKPCDVKTLRSIIERSCAVG